MSEHPVSRRGLLRCFGGVTVAPVLEALVGSAASGLAADDPADEPLIDTHFHLVNLRLPGVAESIPAPDKKTQLAPFDPATKAMGTQQLAKVIQEEMKAAAVG